MPETHVTEQLIFTPFPAISFAITTRHSIETCPDITIYSLVLYIVRSIFSSSVDNNMTVHCFDTNAGTFHRFCSYYKMYSIYYVMFQ